MEHTWKRDASGELEYDEPVDGHGGPRCTACGYWYCVHCHEGGPPEPECEPEAEVRQTRAHVRITVGDFPPQAIPFQFYDAASGLEVRGELLDSGEMRGKWRRRVTPE